MIAAIFVGSLMIADGTRGGTRSGMCAGMCAGVCRGR